MALSTHDSQTAAGARDRHRHFAAWEQPQLFAQEMRSAFRTLR